MLYGLVAWIAVKYRKTLIAAAVFLSVTVGLGTVYMNTHWFSDVVGGWIAGGLVLLALPWVMPTVERWAESALGPPAPRAGRERRAAPAATAPAPSGAHRRSGERHPGELGRRVPRASPPPRRPWTRGRSPTRRGNPRISPIPSGP